MSRHREKYRPAVSCMLLIDDNRTTNTIHKSLIMDSGITQQVVIFHDGSEGLTYLEQKRQEGQFPEIILLDIRMPEVDGFAFLEAYYTRKYDQLFNSLLVVLTNSENPAHIRRVREISDALYMPKPLNEEELEAIFEIYWKRKDNDTGNGNDRT